ncbi:MAG: UDP-N-acetylmuramoyl-L-alanyl-D-glutamate--2,6-diaminopimelate ligase [Nitrospinota bacterium]
MKQTVSTKWFLFSEDEFSREKHMPEKSLENLMMGIETKDSRGSLNKVIEGIAFDSRKVVPGGLFAAIPGKNHNGETFIKDALEKGAIALIAQSPLGSLSIDYNSVTGFCVEDSRKALSRVGSNFYNHPSKEINLTGITGTNGKTTLTYILEALSIANGKKTGVIGTIDCHYSKTSIPSAMTTPESLDLNRILRDMADGGVSDCFIEVSSHALSQKRVFDMDFEVGIFTNLSRDHLDFHSDMEEYKNAKAKLFRENNVKAPVINIDDPAGKELATEFKDRVISTGINNAADYTAEDIVLEESGSRFTLNSPEGSKKIHTNLLGKHNVYNLLSAAAGASALGVSSDIIEEVFQKIPVIPGRFESIDKGQNFTVLVDYAHTDDALAKSIIAAKSFTKGKVIVVFGCGGDRDRGKRKDMGQAALKNADFAIITSDNPRTEDPEQIIKDIQKGIPANADYITIVNRRDAIEYGINKAEKNDLVLIAGKGHEDYQIVGTKKEHFDDREVAGEFLGKRGH